MIINGIPLHDLHLHTGLSLCSGDPTATPELYVPLAKAQGVEMIGIADHLWDARVPVPNGVGGKFGPGYLEVWNILTFERQLAHMAECERLQDGVRILYGVEAEFFSGVLGLHESSIAMLDFVNCAHNHFHQGPPALPEGYKSMEGMAYYMMKSFDDMLDEPGVDLAAHPLTPSIMKGDDVVKLYEMIGQDRFAQSLTKAKEKGVSIEINLSEAIAFEKNPEVFQKTVLWMYRLAKEIGCFFHFGSDAHTLKAFQDKAQPEVYKHYIDLLGLKPENMHPLCFR